MDSSWNIGSIGIGGPALRGPSSTRLLAEPPLSPPVSAGTSPTASAQPLDPVGPAAPLAPPMTPSVDASPSEARPEPTERAATGLESLLIRFRLITSEQLDEALREKLESGKDVGAIVVERGWVNEDQLARLLTYAPSFAAPAEPAVETPEPQAEAVEADAEHASEPQLEPDEAESAEAVRAEPEPTVSAGPIVSAEQAAPAPAAPALEIVSPAYEVAPALELVEPEAASAPAAMPFEPVAPVVEPHAPEPADEPAPAQQHALPAPLAPVQPAAEPVAQPVAEPATTAERTSPWHAEPTSHVETALQPLTAPERETVEPPAEAAAAPSPEPAAPALAPEPQTVRFVEPPAIETIARVFLRLSNGERVEAGSFDDVGAAKARAEEVVREVAQGLDVWPFFGGRYIRPEAIVSVDVDATVVRYA